jgi:hypothetical protein
MIKVQLVISGQYRENYGAHDWDGIGECPQHWKCKNEFNIIVACNVLLTDAPSVMKEIEERMSGFSWSDNGSSCYLDAIQMVPNRLSRSNLIEWQYQAYDEITSISKEEIHAFLKAFGMEPVAEELDDLLETDSYKLHH